MEKIIKKYGESLIININPDDAKIYDLEEGDIVDVEICKSKKKVKDETKN